LAISRTIGDSDAKKIGVIANPEFIEYTITPQTKYIIACSDGIWEFLKNEEVMKIANQFYLKSDPVGLCRELTKRSTTNWLKEDVVVDDITVVTAFF
jgi:serine/threonine protein phosphatase PrpC